MYVPGMLPYTLSMFLTCCIGYATNYKSTAATYTERTIRTKSCLNNLLYNS